MGRFSPAVARDRAPSSPLTPVSEALRAIFDRLQPAHAALRARTRARFEALEPRLLLSADVNPTALTLSGDIGLPGEKDAFEFSVLETRRLVFDSLTNRSDLRWKLEGPTGLVADRTFANADLAAELANGTYRLTVDGTADATGAYALRVIEADAAAELTLGAAVAGTLDGGNRTAVYRFAGAAGDRLYFRSAGVSGGDASWRLIDPFGTQEGLLQSVSSDRDVFSLQRSGAYLLLVEGSNSNIAPVSFGFELRQVQDSVSALALDAVTTAAIGTAGDSALFQFTLAEPTVVWFDGLATPSQFYWSLTGPLGEQVARRQMTDAAAYGGAQWLRLPAGDHTLIVDAEMAVTGAAPFRLLTAASAHALPIDTALAGTLDASRGSALHRVTLQAGDKLFVEGGSVTGGSASWRLVDPYGALAASGPSLATAATLFSAVQAGEHWLVVDGASANDPAQTVSFEVTVHRVVDGAAALALGETAVDTLATPGQIITYAFTLAAPTQLVFDSGAHRGDLLWSLSGPRGLEVGDRPFNQSDAAGGSSMMLVPAGDYRLSVRGAGAATGGYAFRMLDATAADPLTLGAPVSGTLTPGDRTHLYRFTVAAGDRVAFDSVSLTGGGATWRLIDAYGRSVAGSNDAALDRAAFTLTTPGAHTLLFEGRIDNAAPVDYAFQLNAAGNEAQPGLPAGDALTLGAATGGSLSGVGASRSYRFTLAQDSVLVFDSQTNSGSLQWSLSGPRGAEVSNRAFSSSDDGNGDPVLRLAAGEHALTVKTAASSGSYSFRLLDTAAFPALTLGQLISATRTPSSATLGYRFDAAEGDALLIATQSGNGWIRLLDPYGKTLASQAYPSASAALTLGAPVSGTYTVLNEGSISQSGSTTVSFRLYVQARRSEALALNDLAGGTLAGPHETADYHFSLDAPGTLAFDALATSTAAANTQWMLNGPLGTVRDWTSFSASDGLVQFLSRSARSQQPLDLAPGPYTLSIRSTEQVGSTYQFRVLTRDAATNLTPGTAVSGTLDPGNGTALFRFNGQAGERYVLDQITASGTTWWLIDPTGKSLAQHSSTVDLSGIALAVSGEHLVAVSGAFGNGAAPRDYAFNLWREEVVPATLSLNTDLAGSIAQPGQQVRYSFSLAAPTLLMIDAWGAPASMRWSLAGALSNGVSLRAFSEALASVHALPAGDYTLTVAASDATTGAYALRLQDLGAAPALALNEATAASFQPGGRAQAWRFSVGSGDELLFTAISFSDLSSNWRIVDARGTQLRSGGLSSDSSKFSISPGDYFLVLDSNSTAPSASFTFALQRAAVKTAAIALDQAVSGTLDLPGQRAEHRLSLAAPARVLFDSRTDSSDLAWDLTGPSGTLRFNVALGAADFDIASAPIELEVAGEYVLNVYSRSNTPGAFALRLLDLDAAAPLVLDGVQTLTLDAGGARAFAFDAAAGDPFRYRFDAAGVGAAQIVLLDPAGTRLIPPSDARQDQSVTLTRTGRHLLLVEAATDNTDPLELAFEARVLRERMMPLVLGAQAGATLAEAGARDAWAFTLEAPARLVLDALHGSEVIWELSGPAGAVDSGFGLSGVRVFDLEAGDYRVSVQPVASTADYAFRLLDADQAQPLQPDNPVVGSVPAAAAVLYTITAVAGERFLLDASASGTPGEIALYDPQGRQLHYAGLPGEGLDFGNVLGDYLLIVDPADAALDYTLALRNLHEVVMATAPGGTVSGTLTSSSELRSFRFAAELPARLLVHDRGADSGLRWRLAPVVQSSPGGWRTFAESPLDSGIEQLAAGEYLLSLWHPQGASAFGVQLLDVGNAPDLPAAGIGVPLEPAGAVAYRFDLDRAERVRIDVSAAQAADVGWALYDEFGAPLVISATASVTDTNELPAARYYLVLFAVDAASVMATARVSQAPAAPLAVGATAAGSFAAGAASADYAIALAQPSRLAFDALAGAPDYTFRLTDARGAERASGNFGDGTQIGGHLIELAPGDYRLRVTRTLDAGPADYAFRLLPVAQTGVGDLSFGTPLSGTLATGAEAAVHQFVAEGGDVLSVVPEAIGGGGATWTLFDPTGKRFAGPVYDGDARTDLRVSTPGLYTIVLDGTLGAAGPTDYAIGVTLDSRNGPNLPSGDALLLGEPTAGQVAPGTSRSYRFTLDAESLVVISGQADSGETLRWQLRDAAGRVLRNDYDYEDPYFYFGDDAESFALAPGHYAITIGEPYGDGGTDVGFTFHVEDVAHAGAAALGSGIVAGATRLFKTTLTAGEAFAVKPLEYADWEVYGPDFEQIASVLPWQSEFQRLVTERAGDYYFVLRDASGAGSLALRVVTQQTSALAFGATVQGDFADPNNDHVHTFALAQSRRLLLDLARVDGTLSWSLTRGSREIQGGAWDAWSADQNAGPLELEPGEYRLSIATLAEGAGYALRLFDLAAAPLLLPDADTGAMAFGGTLTPGEAEVYRFDGLAGAGFVYEPLDTGGLFGEWQLLDALGARLNGEFAYLDQRRELSALPRDGSYFLVWDSRPNAGAPAAPFAAQLTRDPSPPMRLALNAVTEAMLAADGVLRYRFELPGGGLPWFDALGTTGGVRWRIDDASGFTWSQGSIDGEPDYANALAAGIYTLVFTLDEGAADPGAFRFRLVELTSAARNLVSGAPFSGTIDPAAGLHAFAFFANAGDHFSLEPQFAASGVKWTLLGGASVPIASGDFGAGSGSIELFGGQCYLLLDALPGTPATSYAFIAEVGVPELPLNTTVTAAAFQANYRLHLDQRTWLAFDGLNASGTSRWRLEGPIVDGMGAVVFDQPIASTNPRDPMRRLEPGDYLLTLYNGGNFAFRVLDLAAAVPIAPNTLVSGQRTPGSGAALYRFEAQAGERYYFDLKSGSGLWRLIDPLGNAGFNPLSDVEPEALKISGTYVLVIEGAGSETAASSSFSFNLVRVPNTPVIVLDALQVRPAPDLTLTAFALDPSSGLQTSQTVQVQWAVENRGVLATHVAWNDRIVLRNLDTGQSLASITVPDEGEALAPGATRLRAYDLRLPDGPAAAGRIGISVRTDADNVVNESNSSATGEGNNSADLEVTVALAPYADLVAESVALAPDGPYAPGASVVVSWSTANRGTRSVDTPWSERVEIVNLTRNEAVASALVHDEAALGPGASRARSVQLTWPSGLAAAGEFAFRILVDANGEIPEANNIETGETNNLAQLLRATGPDLIVRNLRADPGTIQAGELVTLRWEDWNDGAVPVPAGYTDRITAINRTTGHTLLDTSLAVDATGLASGQFRERHYILRLPEGMHGAGEIEITVTADRNTAGLGVLFETNLTNDAETNNATSATVQSQPKPYADLRAGALSAPASAVAGQAITASWTVSNAGTAATPEQWNDQLLLSKDRVIGNADDVVLATIRHSGVLQPADAYAYGSAFLVPGVTPGSYYLAVRADSGTEVLEPDTRADNVSALLPFAVQSAYADLRLEAVGAAETAQDSETLEISWRVRNIGTSVTAAAVWNDRVVLSTDKIIDAGDLVLAGAVPHVGALGVNENYVGRTPVTLPRGLQGDFWVLVRTDQGGNVFEDGRTANNSGASIALMRVTLHPTPDLQVSEVSGPAAAVPGQSVTVTWTATNAGQAVARAPWRDAVYLANGLSLVQVATLDLAADLEAGASVQRSATFVIPFSVSEGELRWTVKTDLNDTLFERTAEGNNQASAADTVLVSRPDLAVTQLSAPAAASSGDTIRVQWQVTNVGGPAAGSWTDRVLLSRDGVADASDLILKELTRDGPLAPAETYAAQSDVDLPLSAEGAYQILVVTNAKNSIGERSSANNTGAAPLAVALFPYADLVVTAASAPALTIEDPAQLTVTWTVANQGTGAGRTAQWTDRVVLSRDAVRGNFDDLLLGDFPHDAALAADQAYTRSETVLLPKALSGRFHVQTQAGGVDDDSDVGRETNAAHADCQDSGRDRRDGPLSAEAHGSRRGGWPLAAAAAGKFGCSRDRALARAARASAAESGGSA